MEQNIPQESNNKGIPVFALVILAVVVAGSLFFLQSVLSKKTLVETKSIPILSTPTANIQEPTPITTSTPTPTPLQGSGNYACSALGSCKNWDPQILKENCTVSFADPNCLNQCSDTSKRCKF